jgi:signal transduction histidine kinase
MEDPEYRQEKLEEFKNNNKDHFIIKTEDGLELNKIYYSDSHLLKKLQYYPYFQLGIVFLFILVSYLAFSVSRRAEQDQVWLGMSKETAHQLGTPISSLMAWLEILRETRNDPVLIEELEKDIRRLEKITARFSKIGSQPQLDPQNLFDALNNSVEYMKSRVPKSIEISTAFPENETIFIPINAELFEWVIENICKNAVDALGEKGKIIITAGSLQGSVFIDISDNGKGIPKAFHKTVFNPGYTTKNRGWGLGLSLVKRIVEQYHQGKVYVKNSEPGVGTTFRIVFKKN